MKKLLAGMLVLSLGLFTLGCGGGEKKADKKPAAGGTTPAPSSAPSTPAPSGEKKPK